MDITKKYLKIFWVVFAAITSIVIFLSENYGFGMIDHYCIQGNPVLGFYILNFGISFCSLVVFVGEVLAVWFVLFLIVMVIDLIILPIRIIVHKRKNRVSVIKNPFYE